MPEVIRRYVQKPCADKAKTCACGLEMVQAPFFQQINQGIKQCCHNTEQDDAHKEPIHFKYLRRHSDTIYIRREKIPLWHGRRDCPRAVGVYDYGGKR